MLQRRSFAWLCCLLLLALPCRSLAAAPGMAELFDVDRGEVVRRFPNTPELQRDVARWIYASPGPALQLRLDPDSGIGLKLAFAPPLRIDDDRWNGWIEGPVTEAIVFVSRSSAYPPTLLLLPSNGRVAALRIPGDVRPFLQKYGLDREGLFTVGPT